MCGILGWLGHGEEFRSAGENALARLAKRGPNGRQLWIDAEARVALGNARLAILDPMERSSQPMARDGLRITHNGEIYNFIELRKELSTRGHTFLTTSDTEVLLAAHRAWGDGAMRRLNGMWAFAIWDPARGMLLSRDRLGIKPLFVARGEVCLHFASEIKALLGLACVRWSPDIALLHRFVVTADTADASRSTFFEGIERVPAGSTTWIDPHTLGASEKRFWIPTPDREAAALSLEGAADRLERLVADAIDIRLRSDVPVGLALSGGIDSSTIAATVGDRADRAAIRTFSVVWSGSHDPEEALIARARSATDLQGLVVHADPQRFVSVADQIVWHQDEPFAHSAPLAEWLVHELASSAGTHVVLEGQGADELFGGYQSLAFGARLIDLALQGSIRDLIRETAELRASHPGGSRFVAASMLAAGARTIMPSRYQHRRWASGPLGKPPAGPAPVWPLATPKGFLRRALAEALLVTSLPALLRYADRSSMAHSVEVRLPFLDHRLVSFALGLSDEMLVRGRRTKRVLREVLRRRIPDLADRQVKTGFTAPEDDWIRGPLRAWMLDLISALDGRRIFPAGAPLSVWWAIQSHRGPAQTAWRMAIAELWLRRYVDEGASPP